MAYTGTKMLADDNGFQFKPISSELLHKSERPNQAVIQKSAILKRSHQN